ncbi:MAG: UvrD-helicase domain-containing protein [Deltaproteobacteria bacterium]|nr:UvrD-helicase domain-containing protein [Deltaproteobacteria bacterium]
MTFIADLHIHSHFSRATSRDLIPEILSLWAQKKGISVIGTGDFTHPVWISELREKLVEDGNGLLSLKPEFGKIVESEVPESCRRKTRFLLSGEISCIYKRHGKTRKVHNLILMPDFESVSRLNKKLERIGNISSDGRPILGLDSRDLLEMVLDTSERAFFIPAHIWTPWFSVFGSKSGFDSLEECFDDLTSHIHALETGLSSDPLMNRLLSSLDDYLLISNSDAHSPSKLGREANIFDTEMDYIHMIGAMTTRRGFSGTIEFYPEEGKYHLDGHRKCHVRLEPGETIKYKGLCPSCGKQLTIGVLHRVIELSDRDEPELKKDFSSLIPLTEILSEIIGCGPASGSVQRGYEVLIKALGPELQLLMEVPLKRIEEKGGPVLAKAIERMREKKVIRLGGYDGEFGTIRLFHESEISELAGQISLFKKTPINKELKIKKFIKSVNKGKKVGIVTEEHSSKHSDPLLDVLNEEQKRAVLYKKGNLLITAGPGTGKTLTLSHRVAYLIRSGRSSPGNILAITFTNKAATEMRSRIRSLIAGYNPNEVKVYTFHGFCLDVLRNESGRFGVPTNFSVCTERDTVSIARKVVSKLGMPRREASRFLKELPRLRSQFVTDGKNSTSDGEIFQIFRRYRQRLDEMGMLDLDDIETETLRIFREHPEICSGYAERYPFVFVDEYQDTNPVQAVILKLMVTERGVEICAIGDPDQAIYGFRGADITNYLRFGEDFIGVKGIALSRNYRSTRNILEGATGIMGKKESLKGIRGEGSKILLASCASHAEEAEMVIEQIEKAMGGISSFSFDSGRLSSHEMGEDIGFGDIAVLFRLNSQGDIMEEAFSRSGIPYFRSGEKPLADRYPVNILFRLLQIVLYGENSYYAECYNDLLSERGMKREIDVNAIMEGNELTDIIERATSGHDFDLSSDESMRALKRLRDIAEGFDGDMRLFLDTLSIDRGIDHSALPGDRVAIMSLHAAKGLEWPIVFITGCEDGLIPCSLFGDADEAEEKRLFYVGMTRAQKKLVLSYSAKRMINGREMRMNPSPFLGLIPEGLCGTLERGKWKPRKRPHKQLGLFES